MSTIYRNVPTGMAETTTTHDLLAKAEELILWGESNLPELNRAKGIAVWQNLNEAQKNKVALGLLIQSYIAAMEGWHEMAQLTCPKGMTIP